MFVLWVKEETPLQFCEPDLEVEFVVLVQPDSFAYKGAVDSIEIAQIEFSEVVEA